MKSNKFMAVFKIMLIPNFKTKIFCGKQFLPAEDILHHYFESMRPGLVAGIVGIGPPPPPAPYWHWVFGLEKDNFVELVANTVVSGWLPV